MKSKILKIVIIIAILISIICILGIIYINNLMDNINYTDFSDDIEYSDNEIELDNNEIDEDFFSSVEQISEEEIIQNELNEFFYDKQVINILLLGVDKQGGGNGRTDSIMIASLNTKNNRLMLTSIMRDIYVKIPNHKDNRINAAYSLGGVSLLKQTLRENFGIEINSTIEVDFKSFEKVIDLLGGVEVELTATEANYLNKTNYVSSEESRNLKEGNNILNGSQALGYARIRKVKEINGESNDFGRTARQRRILITLFDKYKNQNLVDLLSTTEKILKIVSTDIPKEDIIKYMTYIITNKISQIETLRLPLDKGYKGALINKMQVIVPDWALTVETLYNFIYENPEEIEIESTEKIILDTENIE